MKLDLSIEDFEALANAANKKTRGKFAKEINKQALQTLLVDHSRALAKLMDLGERIDERYEHSSEVCKAREG